MCGRFERSSTVGVILGAFRIGGGSAGLAPSYNIAPGREVLIISGDGMKYLQKCRWGFVPEWAEAPAKGLSMINARAETVATKPAFRDAFRRSRCLVVADGFYEWRRDEGAKTRTPFHIRLRPARPFGFAGLCSIRRQAGGDPVCTCTIITVPANELLGRVHDRMPVIIPAGKEDLWLDPGVRDEPLLLGMLRPYPAEEMEMREVSPRVNHPDYDDPAAIMPVTEQG